ncbi:MAG: universal stress protein [Pyrinomonadaceae bacterium]
MPECHTGLEQVNPIDLVSFNRWETQPERNDRKLKFMYPFRNILFPTDLSPHARSALKYAAAFARQVDGRVVLFSVQSAKVPPNLLTLPDHIFENHENSWLVQIREEMKELLADPLFHGVEVEPVIVEGEPAAEIARAVSDYEIDLVTVVTHGRKGLSRALGGSTAEEIIAEAACPVLAVRPPQRDFVQHRGTRSEIHLNRVLLATNFRPSSVNATQLASQFVDDFNCELHAVYVIGDYFEQISMMFPEGGLAALSRLRTYVEERMSQISRRMPNIPVKTHISEGRPYEEIVRYAAQTDADLIVMGTTVHPKLFGGTLVLGSEIERVVRNAPCPVLCVPAARAVTPLPAMVRHPLPQT